ncbi:hypothetical protein LCGC14_0854800 [marine sediment metagenome]|uniref:Uncharacterized protein n=1 Tax=marine sediment metagenome TaxID=412755 RepID=A0A0F9PDZ8_9ZZZZ
MEKLLEKGMLEFHIKIAEEEIKTLKEAIERQQARINQMTYRIEELKS